MSADNWARCPRCAAFTTAEFRKREAAINASYGVVSVQEFDDARKKFAADMAAFENRAHTFREDYEIYGAEDGAITITYSGSCGQCGLSFNFEETRPIPGVES